MTAQPFVQQFHYSNTVYFKKKNLGEEWAIYLYLMKWTVLPMPFHVLFSLVLNLMELSIIIGKLPLCAPPSFTIQICSITSQHEDSTVRQIFVELFNIFFNISRIFAYITLLLCLTGRRFITKKSSKTTMPASVTG